MEATAKRASATEAGLTMILDNAGVRPADSYPRGPLAHLGCALGGCLLEMVRRYRERRGGGGPVTARVGWWLDGQGHRLRCLEAQLWLPEALSADESAVLWRMLGSCPVHGALKEGVRLEVTLVTDLTGRRQAADRPAAGVEIP
jgi:hypothetical protein